MTRRQGYEKLLDLVKEGHILCDRSPDKPSDQAGEESRDQVSEESRDQVSEESRGLMISTQIALLLAATNNKSKGLRSCYSHIRCIVQIIHLSFRILWCFPIAN